MWHHYSKCGITLLRTSVESNKSILSFAFLLSLAFPKQVEGVRFWFLSDRPVKELKPNPNRIWQDKVLLEAVEAEQLMVLP